MRKQSSRFIPLPPAIRERGLSPHHLNPSSGQGIHAPPGGRGIWKTLRWWLSLSPSVPQWCRLLRGTPKVPTALHDWVKVVTAPLRVKARQREGNLRGPPPLQEPQGQRSLCANQTEVNSPTSPMTAGIARPARDIGLQLDPSPAQAFGYRGQKEGDGEARPQASFSCRAQATLGWGRTDFKPVRTLRNHTSRG